MSSQSVEYTRYAPVSSEWNIQLHIHSLAGPGRIYLLTHLRANGTPTEESYHIWANLGADQYCTVRHCIIAITHSTESWTGSHSKAGKGLEVSILISWYSTWTHAHWWSDGLVERFFVSRMLDFFDINHATSSNLNQSYYPHRSRELVSPVCGFFSFSSSP